MSTLSYNGIKITMIMTQAFDQTVEYDDSHTDYLYTKVTIKVQGVINRDLSPALANEKNPATTMVRIRKCLMAPRQKLVWNNSGGPDAPVIGPNTMVQSPVPPYIVDANNGPKPIGLSVTQINESTFMVVYTIETYLNECCTGNKLPYLSNRWKEEHAIDQHGYIDRTISGKIVFTSELTSAKTQPGSNNEGIVDHYRSALAPPNLIQPGGFYRINQKYTSSEDGLQLMYEIKDRQQYCIINNFISKFEGSRERKWKATGGVFDTTITVRCWAPPTVSKSNVLKAAAETLAACFDGIGIPLTGHTSDNLHENFFEISVTWAAGKPKSLKNGGEVQHVFQDNVSNLKGIGGELNMDKTVQLNMFGEYKPSTASQFTMQILDKYLGMCSAATKPTKYQG
jgi:hypothetical protein